MPPQLSWQVLSDGYTQAAEAVAWPAGSWFRRIRFHATAFLLRHPQHGPTLVDAGYSRRFLELTRRGWGRLYRAVTPVTLTEPGGIAALVDADSIRRIIITHFHVDHIGGLRDFPQAEFYCSQAAWESARRLKGLAAIRNGFLPGLLPEDFASRVRFVDESTDFWGDGSLRFHALPGHAVGQLGVEFADAAGPVLLCADACWLSAAYRESRAPHWITRLLHDAPAYAATLERLHRLSLARPELRIYPTHCPETAALLPS